MNIRYIGLYTGWVLLGLMALSACQNDQAVRRVAPAVPTLPEIAQLPGAAWVMPAGTGWVQKGDRIAFTLPEGYRMHYYDETGALANTSQKHWIRCTCQASGDCSPFIVDIPTKPVVSGCAGACTSCDMQQGEARLTAMVVHEDLPAMGALVALAGSYPLLTPQQMDDLPWASQAHIDAHTGTLAALKAHFFPLDAAENAQEMPAVLVPFNLEGSLVMLEVPAMAVGNAPVYLPLAAKKYWCTGSCEDPTNRAVCSYKSVAIGVHTCQGCSSGCTLHSSN